MSIQKDYEKNTMEVEIIKNLKRKEEPKKTKEKELKLNKERVIDYFVRRLERNRKEKEKEREMERERRRETEPKQRREEEETGERESEKEINLEEEKDKDDNNQGKRRGGKNLKERNKNYYSSRARLMRSRGNWRGTEWKRGGGWRQSEWRRGGWRRGTGREGEWRGRGYRGRWIGSWKRFNRGRSGHEFTGPVYIFNN